MPNYIYLLQRYHVVDRDDYMWLKKLIEQWALLSALESMESDQYFVDPLIRQIMLEAYPYEVELKFLQQNVADDTQRNERLIWLFDELFATDYHEVLDTYTHDDQLWAIAYTQQAHDERVYEDLEIAKKQYIDFSYKLFVNQWYEEEARALQHFCKDMLDIAFEEGISGVTSRKQGKIYIWLWNKTYTTLFHEMTHAINNYFRFEYYASGNTCDHKTKTNEWLSNFVAYHIYEYIVWGDIESLDQMSLEPMFFSMYIDIYKSLTIYWHKDAESNRDLVHTQLRSFEWSLLTDDKADFYYQRFYKYFHYDQHTYMYPKELMYYLGYRWVLQLFDTSKNKKSLLAQALLWRVCL